MLASHQLSLCSWSYHSPLRYATALTRHPFMPSSVLKVGTLSQPSCLADWWVSETVIHHQTTQVPEWQFLQLYNSSTQSNFRFYFSKSSEMWYVPLGLSPCMHGMSYIMSHSCLYKNRALTIFWRINFRIHIFLDVIRRGVSNITAKQSCK
jgi:hypothetical protein